jgi:hypothetical protein
MSQTKKHQVFSCCKKICLRIKTLGNATQKWVAFFYFLCHQFKVKYYFYAPKK